MNQESSKGRGWVWLRLLSLPFAALTALIVVVPARLVSGPEALVVFYLGLVTVGPPSWFGLHWLAGAMLSPRLTRAESNRVAITGMAIVLVPLLVISRLQGPAFTTSQKVNERIVAGAERVSGFPGRAGRFVRRDQQSRGAAETGAPVLTNGRSRGTALA